MLPSYYLPQPAANWDEATIASFERLYDESVESVQGGTNSLIHYTLPAPKWQFLCYLCNHKDVLLHGSGETDIVEFEPRQSNDVGEFGNRRAVYAASDGIWPMYFAVVNRNLDPLSLINSCFHVVEGEPDAAVKTGPYYYFSLNEEALSQNPWRPGMIYVLPKATFEQQSVDSFQGRSIEIAQWASPVAVKPLAKLAVTPDDFPFLTQTRPHNIAVIRARSQANPDDFPWVADDEV